ncbi:MAG: EutN/CcmL family microcompartment protein [Acidimicrobiia bacterium]|nr:EutN/CcmL family microcompartment protein [Acidimicrobiia bacterium]
MVSPISHPFFERRRLLVCDLLDGEGSPNGYLIAVDVVGAGAGERVLICDEGSSARQIFGIDTGPIRAVIVGIIDDIA